MGDGHRGETGSSHQHAGDDHRFGAKTVGNRTAEYP